MMARDEMTPMVRTLGPGPPLIMIPGVDGHCTWLEPVIAELSRHFTVITFSLWGERDSGHRFDESRGFEPLLAQVGRGAAARGRRARDALRCIVWRLGGLELCGASSRARRCAGARLCAAAGLQPNARQTRYLGAPILTAPMFVLTSPGRVLPEICDALPTWRERIRFSAGQLLRVARTRISPTRMAARMRVAKQVDFFEACRRITMPTLVVTGQPGLDRVVPAEETWKYLKLIPGSESLRLRDGPRLHSHAAAHVRQCA